MVRVGSHGFCLPLVLSMLRGGGGRDAPPDVPGRIQPGCGEWCAGVEVTDCGACSPQALWFLLSKDDAVACPGGVYLPSVMVALAIVGQLLLLRAGLTQASDAAAQQPLQAEN
jgi:hypothetical protein